MCAFFAVSFSYFALRMQQLLLAFHVFFCEKKNKRFFTYVSFLPRLAIFKKIKRKTICLNIPNPFSSLSMFIGT
jgi:hypothetical protein